MTCWYKYKTQINKQCTHTRAVPFSFFTSHTPIDTFGGRDSAPRYRRRHIQPAHGCERAGGPGHGGDRERAGRAKGLVSTPTLGEQERIVGCWGRTGNATLEGWRADGGAAMASGSNSPGACDTSASSFRSCRSTTWTHRSRKHARVAQPSVPGRRAWLWGLPRAHL